MKYLAAIALGTLTSAAAVAQTVPAAPAAPAPAAPAASAQTAPAAATAAPTVGSAIYDSAGVEIGKVDSLTADAAVVNTGTAKVALPLTAIGAGAKGPSISMTKAQLDQAAAAQQTQAAGALQSRLTPGTSVKSRNGTAVVGTIKSADAQYVTLTTTKGDVKLPTSGFAAGADGGIIVGLTAEQFDAAVGGGAAASTSGAGSTATSTSATAAPADATTTTTTTTQTATDPAAATTTETTKTTKKTKKAKN